MKLNEKRPCANKRDASFRVLTTQSERDAIVEAAISSGKSLSEFVRETLKEKIKEL